MTLNSLHYLSRQCSALIHKILVVAMILLCGLASGQEKSPEPTREQKVKQNIEEWTKEFETLKATAPPDAVLLQERLGIIDATIAAGQRHLQSLEILSGIEVRARLIEKLDAEWKGPGKSPPYPWADADRYRSSLLAAREALASGRDLRKVGDQTMQILLEKLSQAEAAVRRAQDVVGRATDDKAKAVAQQSLDLENARLRLIAEQKEEAAVQIEAMETSLRMEKSKESFAKRQLDALGTNLVFSKEDLDRTLAGIKRNKSERTEERVKALRGSRSALNTRLAELGTTSRADVLSWQIALLELREALWQSRYNLINAPDDAAKYTERQNLKELFTRPPMWRSLFEVRLRSLRASIFEVESRRKDNPNAVPDEVLAELKGVDSLMQDAINEATELATLRAIWNLAEDDGLGPSNWREWLAAAPGMVSDSADSIWNYELYTVDDTMNVDGRVVTTKRGITVGKIIILLLILSIGYYLIKTISGRITRRVQSKLHLDNGKAQSLQRAILILGMIGLGLYSLNYVSIPLTAFAFLGGALVLGVGFGTQNLIKNFISGLLIHAEKPLRVGDVLEVGQINGTIVEIGMRSSVIRHWDGIETLIPNSTFLENNVTNWTYSDRHLRHSVKVGVAYESDPRDVAHLLQQAAEEHGLVLSSPAPFVLFDDFAESTLVFSLFFWIDVTKAGRSQVASDLRFIIMRRFKDAGISMAFPQRDMHLATTEPISVRMMYEDKPG